MLREGPQRLDRIVFAVPDGVRVVELHGLVAGESLRFPIWLSVASTWWDRRRPGLPAWREPGSPGRVGRGVLGAISHLTSVAFAFLLYEWVGLGSDELQNVSLFGGC